MLNHKRIVALVLCFALALTVIGAALAYGEAYLCECGGIMRVGTWECIKSEKKEEHVFCTVKRVDNCPNGHSNIYKKVVMDQHGNHN